MTKSALPVAGASVTISRGTVESAGNAGSKLFEDLLHRLGKRVPQLRNVTGSSSDLYLP